MTELSSTSLLEIVNSTHVSKGNPRTRKIVARIVTDLFKAIEELDVTPDEFWQGVAWLTRLGATGQTGLVTAGLGFDRLLDIRLDEKDHRAGRSGGTPRAIEGPLYITDAPLSCAEARLDEGQAPGVRTLVMEGRVHGFDGTPLSGAIVDVWHCNEHGRYSHFDPNQQAYNLRRRIAVDAQGRYRFRSFVPPGYAIPPNSPTAELFEQLGRHGNRPAHVHFLVSAPGARSLTTQINIPGDAFLNDDFAFATREDLVVELEPVGSPAGYESLGIQGPFTRVRFDFCLQSASFSEEEGHLARSARAGVGV